MGKPNKPNVNLPRHGPRAQVTAARPAPPPLATRPPQPNATHAHAPAQPCRSCHAPNANAHAPNTHARVPVRPQAPAAAPRANAALQPKAATHHATTKAATPRPTVS